MARQMKDSGVEWIGQIPAEWKRVKLKEVTNIIMGQSPEAQDIKDFGNIPFMQGNREFGSIYPNAVKFCDNSPKKSRIGDILLSVRAPVGAINVSDKVYAIGRGLCSICATSINSKFLMYFLMLIMQDTKKFGQGSTFDAITIQELKQLPVLLPPINTQNRIASYLDRKCAEIDAIIAKQQQVIEKLKEYKLSVITEAVTKGLDPNVPMKDSGVEWIGKVPEHWKVPKIKYLATIASGGTPDRSHPEYWNGSINWAKTGELQNSELYETEEKITELALENSSAKVFAVDTILVAMYGQGKTRGMTALLKIPSATNQACAGITIYSKDITVSYLWLFLMGAYDAIREKANGSGQPNLSGALIADFNVTLPPVEEQINICKTIAMHLPHIDSIIKQKEAMIDRLVAYKKSLIYEVVTGKKEVKF